MGDEAQVGIRRLLGGLPDLERLTLELHVFKDFVCSAGSLGGGGSLGRHAR
jgi:hypothetical protein